MPTNNEELWNKDLPEDPLQALYSGKPKVGSIDLEQYMKPKPLHPGLILKQKLKDGCFNQSAVADKIGIAATRLNEICNGKRNISPKTAIKLEEFLGEKAEKWLAWQSEWELYHLRLSK